MIIVLEAVNGMVSAVSFPAMASMVPQLVPRAELQRANALLSLSRSGLTIIGPTVGALLVVTIGAGWALAADAASWLLASLLLLRVHLPARAPRDDAPPPNMLRELKEGWSVFIGYTWLWIVVVAFGVLNAIQAGAWFTIGPAVAEHTIGKQGWGFALSAESAGLVLTTLVMLRLSLRRPLYTGMIGCSLLAVPMFMLGFDPHVVPLVIAAFAGGVGIEVFSMGWSLAMQENIDEHLLSRAYSYDSLGSFVAMPIGQLVYGPLGTAFGFGNVLMVSGVVYAFVALVTLGSRSVRSLERAPVKPSPGGAAP
jgi:MFS family permease